MIAYIDYETRSRVDLKKSGLMNYAHDGSTDLLSVSCYTDKMYTAGYYETDLIRCIGAMVSSADAVVVHNRMFEYFITKCVMVHKHGWDYIPLEKFYCTMSASCYLNYGTALDSIQKFLGLPFEKHDRGRKYMLSMTKFQAPSRGTTFDDAWGHLKKYNESDVVITRYLCSRLELMPDRELNIRDATDYQNMGGCLIDVPFVDWALEVSGRVQSKIKEELITLTGGEISTINQVLRIKKFVNARGLNINNLAEATLKEIDVDSIKDTAVRRVLYLRMNSPKASVDKLKRIKDFCFNGRVHHYIHYHGASTGRYSGRGVQVQNIKRFNKESNTELEGYYKRGDTDLPIDKALKIGDIVRRSFIADEGKEIVSADYTAIEARILVWLAGQANVLELYHEGKDVYKHMATMIYNKREEDVSSRERFIAKSMVLGLGYQMGARTFYIYLRGTVDMKTIESYVRFFRKRYFKVVNLWRELDRAVVRAVLTPGYKVIVAGGRVSFIYDSPQKRLVLTLPNGKQLFYHNIKTEKDTYGNTRVSYLKPNLMRLHLYGGVITENICQAIGREILCDAMLSLVGNGVPVLFTIHDEVVLHVDEGTYASDEITRMMQESTDKVFKNIPIDVEVVRGKFLT